MFSIHLSVNFSVGFIDKCMENITINYAFSNTGAGVVISIIQCEGAGGGGGCFITVLKARNFVV